jgi:sugar phosphate isomerase/epimerase
MYTAARFSGKETEDFMSTSRRSFLGAGAAAAAAAAAGTRRILTRAWSDVLRAESLKAIGLQLYTVRTELAKDFDGALAGVAAAGFKEVEFAGYFDHSPQQVRDSLRRHGLAAPSAHVDYASLGDKWPAVIDAAHAIGHQYLVNPFLDEDLRKQPDVWKRVAASFNRAGELSRKAGIQFAYHNHHFEFVATSDGSLPYDVLLKECDPGLVKMEMDLCWVTVAGADPVAYFARYPGRFPMVHVKGLKKVPPKPGPGQPALPFDQAIPLITDVGGGDVIDWKRIFAHASQGGVRHFFVEHDQPASPFDSITHSYQYLHGLQF